MTRGEALSVDNAGSDRIELVVLGGPAADDVFAGRRSVLGFAILSASRVYVHYNRVHALARHHRIQPGWFLGVVIAHELAHVLVPDAGHSERGVMAPMLSPDPKVPPTFADDEAQWIRARLLGEAIVARLRFP